MESIYGYPAAEHRENFNGWSLSTSCAFPRLENRSEWSRIHAMYRKGKRMKYNHRGFLGDMCISIGNGDVSRKWMDVYNHGEWFQCWPISRMNLSCVLPNMSFRLKSEGVSRPFYNSWPIGSMYAIYGYHLPSIYPIHVSINLPYMDSMGEW